jgi:hypothetical protein
LKRTYKYSIFHTFQDRKAFRKKPILVRAVQRNRTNTKYMQLHEGTEETG